MAHLELPCENGVCMVCSVVPPDSHVLQCDTCACYWHMQCLVPPLATVPEGTWACPDCSFDSGKAHARKSDVEESDLLKKIREIQADKSLSETEKARKRQEVMSNGATVPPAAAVENEEDVICLYCRGDLDRPVTTPCGHNFCLKCLQRWFSQGKKQCGKCRASFDRSFIEQPRINSHLALGLRMKKMAAMGSTSIPKTVHYIQNDNRPDKAFVTERAKRNGKANAASGKIFVTVGPHHFGPIPAENDPTRNMGVLVGESWADRMDCRQWGAHRPHVAGIAGQSEAGAQSVALSGGYQDDEDHGEWFLYTGSGGRDLSGNRRTNKQSFDQTFTNLNKALLVSCMNGYPVRVVRSHKEKRSAYAPQEGVRYDGVYRIEKCWRKTGLEGFLVCRYLFVRCDNEPAPWTSDAYGDRPRPVPDVAELKHAIDVKERKKSPSWDWKADEDVWGWTRPPPISKEVVKSSGGKQRGQKSKEKELKTKFGCGICKEVLQLPLCTPCGHNFCESCLVGQFSGQTDIRERGNGRRALRVRRNVKRCPSCNSDISDFMENPRVNREMDSIIQSLKNSIIASEKQVETAEDEIEDEEDAAGDEGEIAVEEEATLPGLIEANQDAGLQDEADASHSKEKEKRKSSKKQAEAELVVGDSVEQSGSQGRVEETPDCKGKENRKSRKKQAEAAILVEDSIERNVCENKVEETPNSEKRPADEQALGKDSCKEKGASKATVAKGAADEGTEVLKEINRPARRRRLCDEGVPNGNDQQNTNKKAGQIAESESNEQEETNRSRKANNDELILRTDHQDRRRTRRKQDDEALIVNQQDNKNSEVVPADTTSRKRKSEIELTGERKNRKNQKLEVAEDDDDDFADDDTEPIAIARGRKYRLRSQAVNPISNTTEVIILDDD